MPRLLGWLSGPDARARTRWWVPRWMWLIVAGFALAAFALDSEDLDAAPRLCLFRNVFGIPCPGCGMAHAFVACAHGDLSGAFAANLLGPVLFVVALAFGLRVALGAARSLRAD